MSNLYDESWWKTATAADVRSELDANANLLADGNYNRSAGYPVYQGWTPLHWAAGHGTVATIQVLLEAGADVAVQTHAWLRTPLHVAAAGGTPANTQVLIDAGANTKARDSLGKTPLHDAVYYNMLENIPVLLAAGANVKARDEYFGNTPLHFEDYHGNFAIIQVLLAAGADVMAPNKHGNTPLHLVNKTEEIQALLAAGADVMARNIRGATPLHIAARCWDPETIQVLLVAGADVMAKDEIGCTPLHWAAECNWGCTGNVKALLGGGADGKATDNWDLTPWDLAQGNEYLKDTEGYWALNDARFK